MKQDNTIEKLKGPTYEEKLRDLYKAKKFEEALQLVMGEEQKQPQAPKILAAKATLLGVLGKHRESIDAANEALKLNANDFELLNTKGVSLYYLERYSEAIETFDACLALKPNFPIAIQKKISALTILGKYPEAARVYEESDPPRFTGRDLVKQFGFCLH